MISGQEIKAARNRAKISQKRLAELLGVDVKTVNNWEAGRVSPRANEEALRQFIAAHPMPSASASPPLAAATDQELLDELKGRLTRLTEMEVAGDGNNLDQKTDDDAGVVEFPRAARKKTGGRSERDPDGESFESS